MIYSLGEIDALSKRAARGAGLEWGYAEEAAKSARWLAAHQLPGVTVLAKYLTQWSKLSQQRAAISEAQATSLDSDAALCPLKEGAQLCDHGKKILQKPIRLQQLAAPLLLASYIGQLAQSSELGVKIHWSGVILACHGGRLLRVKVDNLSASLVEDFYCEPASISDQGDFPGAVGQEIDAQDWASLNELAQHIYVPASDASRRGAGPTQ